MSNNIKNIKAGIGTGDKLNVSQFNENYYVNSIVDDKIDDSSISTIYSHNTNKRFIYLEYFSGSKRKFNIYDLKFKKSTHLFDLDPSIQNFIILPNDKGCAIYTKNTLDINIYGPFGDLIKTTKLPKILNYQTGSNHVMHFLDPENVNDIYEINVLSGKTKKTTLKDPYFYKSKDNYILIHDKLSSNNGSLFKKLLFSKSQNEIDYSNVETILIKIDFNYNIDNEKIIFSKAENNGYHYNICLEEIDFYCLIEEDTNDNIKYINKSGSELKNISLYGSLYTVSYDPINCQHLICTDYETSIYDKDFKLLKSGNSTYSTQFNNGIIYIDYEEDDDGNRFPVLKGLGETHKSLVESITLI